MNAPTIQPACERPATSDPAVRSTVLLGFPPVLDACCGGRMMWFDKHHPLAIFMDKRKELVSWESDETVPGKESKKHRKRELCINPDRVGDFTAMPFPDDTFALTPTRLPSRSDEK